MGILEHFGALDDDDGDLEDFSLLGLGSFVDLEVISCVGCLMDFDSEVVYALEEGVL